MRILNIGSANVDYVYSLDHIAIVGETESAQELNVFPGGKGLNQSIAIKRAGKDVCHAGCIGEGGEILLDILQENGVDTSFVKRVSERNGHAIIQVSKDGDNTIFLYRGSNGMFTTEQIDDILSEFTKGDILALQNEINNLDYIVKKAHQIEMTIVLNPAPFNERICGIDFNMISYLVLNEIEAREISKSSGVQEALRYFAEKYPNLKVMLTLGSKGCVYQDKEHKVFCPTFKVVPVDTTGAGDTFTGYFIVGIANGDEIEKILKVASCAAAISITREGAAPSIPCMAEVMEQLNRLETNNADAKTEMWRKKIDEYIDCHMTDASLDGLADHLGYSSVYTGALVKKVTGKTYKSLLQEKRLVVAEILLLKTDLSIDEIIKKTGYENASFFRRIFKGKYGVTPLNYRKRKDK